MFSIEFCMQLNLPDRSRARNFFVANDDLFLLKF